jgi:hypothetical protein
MYHSSRLDLLVGEQQAGVLDDDLERFVLLGRLQLWRRRLSSTKMGTLYLSN